MVLEERKASLDYKKKRENYTLSKKDIIIIRRKGESFERTHLEEIFPRLHYSGKLKLQIDNYAGRQIEMA